MFIIGVVGRYVLKALGTKTREKYIFGRGDEFR